MTTSRDLYAVLGVEKAASQDEIRQAYRALARKFHPDVNPGDRQAETQFKEASAAYEVLSDGEKRKLYDEFGEEGLKGGFDPEQARTYQKWRQTRESAGRPFTAEHYEDFDLSDLFGGDFHTHGPRHTRSRRGHDAVASLELTLLQALQGTEVSLVAPSGEQEVTVRIPPGAADGDRLRVPGRGMAGVGGGPSGDLLVEVHVRPHPHFHRDNLDLTLRLPVTLEEAYCGARVDVPTPDGSVTLKIPPRSQQGSKLRLKGKGVNRAGRRGDMYVELDVRLPDKEHPALDEVLRDTAGLYSKPVREEIRL